jgi:CYTH domain-containing protein
VDRYIEATRLRLRQITDCDGREVFKLTQKLPEQSSGARQGLITTIHLARGEFDVLAELPAKTLRKTRHSLPPFGIDVFEGPLQGLILAEAEFDSAGEAAALVIPSFVAHEVTNDFRFTGGNLAGATGNDLERWLGDYGVKLP